MYIKLTFNADKPLNYIFRIVNECVNNTAITSVSTLSTVATNGSWNSTLLQDLNTTQSEIIRTGTGVTGLTSNTVSHYTKNGTNATYFDEHAWTVEFSRHDDLTKKYYVQHNNTSGYNSYLTVPKIADGISAANNISTVTQMAPTVAPSATSGTGTAVTLNASAYTGSAVASSSSGFTNVRTFFMYISDTCMIWCATPGTTYNVGFGNTYNDATKFIGPFIYSQYTRFDYTNTNYNGISPLLFTNPTRGTGIGFGGATADWTAVENTQFNNGGNYNVFKVFNLINTYPTTSGSFPVIAQPFVSWGIGSRFSDLDALTASGAGSTGTATTPAYKPAIFTTVSTRYPSADLKSQSYGMLPVSWRNLYYYNAGGDASAKGGWYCFNGDYFPGDEYTYNGKVYKILPTFSGYSQRVGIAIPKE